MTIKELKRRLEKLPENWEVFLQCGEITNIDRLENVELVHQDCEDNDYIAILKNSI